MNWNPRFLQLSRQAFNPFLPSSGTENVACLLYAIARMLRPRTIVEYGSGYTTLYLLAALAENTSDAKEEGTLLRAKTEKLTEREIVFSRASPNGRDATQKRRELEWFSSGDKACGVDPGFFRQAYMPRLYSIERLSSDHDYSKRLLKTVMELDLAEFLTYLTGCEFSPHILPAEAFPLDLAWNDDDEYITFFDTLWPHLNPSGGLMVFHNTVAVEEAWNAIATIKQKRSAHGDLEVLTLPEPHKLSQSSCTILRRTTDYEPSFARRTRERVVDDLLGFMQGNAGQKNESA